MKKPLEKSMRSVMDFFIDFELRNPSKMAPKPFQKPSRTDIKNGEAKNPTAAPARSADPPGPGRAGPEKKKSGLNLFRFPPKPPR